MVDDRSQGVRMSTEKPYEYSARGFWADLVGTFAGVLLMIAGIFQILQGGSAVANDDLYSAGNDYLYQFDMDVWGTVHLVIGAVSVVVSVGILRGKSWAQVAGMIVAGVSSVANFAFLPEYPLWAITVIAFDLVVIWALSAQYAHGRRVASYKRT
jgi:hypothetical protein